MLEIISSNRFRKDIKKIAKRGYNIALLGEVVNTLAALRPLPERHRDHAITSDYSGFRECHILPDRLLIYRVVSRLRVSQGFESFAVFIHASCIGTADNVMRLLP